MHLPELTLFYMYVNLICYKTNVSTQIDKGKLMFEQERDKIHDWFEFARQTIPFDTIPSHCLAYSHKTKPIYLVVIEERCWHKGRGEIYKAKTVSIGSRWLENPHRGACAVGGRTGRNFKKKDQRSLTIVDKSPWDAYVMFQK